MVEAKSAEAKRGPGQRGPHHVRLVPDELNKAMRERLQRLRTSLGMSKTDSQAASASSWNNYESKDISRVDLGMMAIMAEEFGWSLPDFMVYLAGKADEEAVLPTTSKNIRRIGIYLRSLPEDLQDTACELVRALVEYNADHGGKLPRTLHLNDSIAERSREKLSIAVQQAREAQRKQHQRVSGTTP